MSESPFVRETKAVIQRVYEYVARGGRPISVREIIGAMPDASRSSITFSLTRLVREGDLKRVGHGKYVVAREVDDPTIDRDDDDAYLFNLLERVREVLSFADLAFLFEVIEAARRLTPEVFRTARDRGKRLSK